MHPNNPHRHGYDFAVLCDAYPPLKKYTATALSGKLSIDFSQPDAVKALNAALLKHYYKVPFWDIPAGYLCPAVPGRADYLHFIADLLQHDTGSQKQDKNAVRGLDIGTGANLIYPIIASQEFGWQMLGTDVHTPSIASAKVILNSNSALQKRIKLKQQHQSDKIFTDIINPHEYFTFTMCNPPFHASASDALAGSRKKNKNLARHAHKRRGADSTAHKQDNLNFGGQHNELWCEGGELAFVTNMIKESQQFAQQVRWFTCLLSKKDSVAMLKPVLQSVQCAQHKVIEMKQGAKASRFIAWRF